MSAQSCGSVSVTDLPIVSANNSLNVEQKRKHNRLFYIESGLKFTGDVNKIF